jgi:hypothetical protein
LFCETRTIGWIPGRAVDDQLARNDGKQNYSIDVENTNITEQLGDSGRTFRHASRLIEITLDKIDVCA